MKVMTFRPGSRQLRNLSLAALGCAAVSAAILVGDFAAHVDSAERGLGLGIGLGFASLLVGWVLIGYRRAFTECSRTGIRARGLTGPVRIYRWDQVEEIAIRRSNPARGPSTFTVSIFTTGGGRFTLGAPVTGGVMSDPDFEAKVRKIRSYWLAGAGVHGGADTALIPSYVGRSFDMSIGSALRWGTALILAGAVVALPFTVGSGGPALTVRLGQGEDGSFTANAYACESACYWIGDYRARDGSLALTGVVMAPGGSIAHAGERVRAVYAHDGALVYPPGGGTAWIPLAIALTVIAVCLPLLAVWILGWHRRRRPRITPDEQHLLVAALADASDGRGGRRIGGPGIGVALGVVIIILAGGGDAVTTVAREVPSAAAPAAVACADYSAWALAQTDDGPPGRDPGLLTYAERQAPAGQLSADLDALGGDVNMAIGAGASKRGLVEQIAVAHDMHSVSKDCS